jgi:glyceraldehyde 3-phosphate dehydrogenase
MAAASIGLMGFGRIGRDLFRILYQTKDVQIAAISDIADHKALEYLLRFDTILGPFPDEISIKSGNLYVAGKQIPMLSEEKPGDVNWSDLGVETVIEATARSRTKDELRCHLEKGAKRVILCVPQETPPDITVVMGVNDDQLKPEHRIISNASCTAHCAAPIIKILNEAFGINRAFLSTVHAYTNQQRLADVPTEDKRSGRAAAENIIPQASNVTQVLTELIPELADLISGESMNVPVPNGSVVDLVCWHEKAVTTEAVNEVIRTAAGSSRWRHILKYLDDPIVSSDIIRSPYSSSFDSLATMVMDKGKVSKTLSWYDNSWGYANRVVDLVRKLHDFEKEAK